MSVLGKKSPPQSRHKGQNMLYTKNNFCTTFYLISV